MPFSAAVYTPVTIVQYNYVLIALGYDYYIVPTPNIEIKKL